MLTPREREVIAIHEASHAVVARAIGQTVGGGAQKLSIVARGRTLGTATSQLVDKDVTVLQEPDLQRQLTAIVAGAAGERVHFGMVSTAINDDLHAATNLARSMVTSFGMSPELGLVTIGEQGGEVFLGASLQELGSVGPATLELIDREVERIVAEAVERATTVLRANWPAVRETAQVLLDHETVSGVALEALLTPVVVIEIEDVQLNGRRTSRGRPSDRARVPRARAVGRAGVGVARRTSRAGGWSSPPRRRARRFRSRSARPGGLTFWAPNRGLLAVEGNSVVPRGILAWDGESLAHAGHGLRRPGRHDADRVGRADRVLDGHRAEPPASGLRDGAVPLQGRPGRRPPTRPPTTPPTPTAR